jgi:hypothetical protein
MNKLTYQCHSHQTAWAVQEVAVEPVHLSNLPALSGKSKSAIAAGFDPFVVPAGKRMVVEISGRDGRMVQVKVKGRVFRRE